MTGKHQGLVGQGEHLLSQRSQHRGMVATGQVGAPDAAGEQHVTGQDRGRRALGVTPGPVGDAGQPEHHRALGVPGGVRDGHGQAGELDDLGMDDGADVVRLAPGRRPPELGAEHVHELGVERCERVLQAVAVCAVNQRRDTVRTAHGRHRVHMVGVAVGQQHGGGPQPARAQHLAKVVQDPDARVDDQALLPLTGCDDVAVGRKGGGGEPGDQHRVSLPSADNRPGDGARCAGERPA